MVVFSPAHLGKWEELFRDLVEGETSPLTGQGTWILADRPGLIAVFDEAEVVYIGASEKIGKTLQVATSGGAEEDLRTLVAEVEYGASRKSSSKRARSGPLAQKVSRRIQRMRYRVASAPAAHLKGLTAAFTVVADPRYNGPTARANNAIDSLPK